jgi:hypothetical protein
LVGTARIGGGEGRALLAELRGWHADAEAAHQEDE